MDTKKSRTDTPWGQLGWRGVLVIALLPYCEPTIEKRNKRIPVIDWAKPPE